MLPAHRFPPAREDDLTLSAQHEDYKEEHARHWGRWWKRSFKDEEDEAAKLKTFRERAEQVDRVTERADESPPGGPGQGPRGQCLRPFVAIVVAISLVAIEALC